MLEIEYKGGNGVIIATKQTTAVVDPKLSLIGLKDLDVKNSVEITTEPRFKIENENARLVIESPGDYEVGDFSVSGTSATRHIDAEGDEKIATIYRIEVNDVRIALLGNIAAKLTDEQLEAIGVVDIVILPIGGGGYTLDATNAVVLARQIDPKVVIPVHYADTDITYEVPQDSLDSFTKELGVEVEKVVKYKLKSAAALPSALTIVEIARS